MSKKLRLLTAGSLVKLNECGMPKKYIFLQYNHYGQQEVTLLRKDVLENYPYMIGTYNSTSYGAHVNYGTYDLRYQQHLNCLDPAIRAAVVPVPLPVTTGFAGNAPTWIADIKYLNRGCFALSVAEVNGAASTCFSVEGTAFPLFTNEASRIAYYDETTAPMDWGLRTPYYNPDKTINRDWANYVELRGYVMFGSAVRPIEYAPRPAITLNPNILVSDSVDGDGCYVVEDAVVAGEEYQKVNGVWRRMV